MSALDSISKDAIRSRGFTEVVGAAGVIPKFICQVLSTNRKIIKKTLVRGESINLNLVLVR